MRLSNLERTNDRDFWWSETMRLPDAASEGCEHLRSCDFDPTLFCDYCNAPVFVVEVTRGENPKGVRYIKRQAGVHGVTPYLIRHNEQEPFEVTNLWQNETRKFTRAEWKQFCEDKFREHVREKHKS